MFGWLKELLEIRYEFRERKLRLHEEQISTDKVCASCEILKIELENSRAEKRQLLERVLAPPVVEANRTEAPEPQKLPMVRRHIPWSVKQQALEQEDRAKAIALKNAAKPDSVEDLEKELDIASKNREAEGGPPTARING